MSVNKPHILLVEPQIPANLGFVARLMNNFGMGELRQIGGCEWKGTDAERTGAPAPERLASLTRFPDLQTAAADCTHMVGLTARAGRHRTPIPLAKLHSQLTEWGPRAQIGLVFGREDRGLETSEVEQCHCLVSIPTQGLGSLNLSHAVGLVAYTWQEWAELGEMPTPPGTGPSEAWPSEPIAPSADRQRLADSATSELLAAEFRDAPDEWQATLRRLVAMPMQARDLRVLERFIRHARWRREQGR